MPLERVRTAQERRKVVVHALAFKNIDLAFQRVLHKLSTSAQRDCTKKRQF